MAENTKFAEAALRVTQKWAAEELEAARARATNLRVGGRAYNDAIESVDNLVSMINSISFWLGEEKPPEITPEPVGVSLIEMGPAPVETEPEPEKPTRVIDISEVRTKAKEARDAGVKLADVWAAFDGTKLSDVPSEKYGEVFDLLEKKMQEAGD